MGRKDDAILVWEQGYERAVNHSTDLKQLLELEELLKVAKQERNSAGENHAIESAASVLLSESGPQSSENSNGSYENHNGLRELKSCGESKDASEVDSKSINSVGVCDGVGQKDRGKEKVSSQMNGNHNIRGASRLKSESFEKPSDRCNELSTVSSESSSDLAQTSSTLSIKLATPRNEMSEESNKNKKFCVTRISKTKSISLDFRLSRGIAEVHHKTTSEWPQLLFY